MDKNPIKIIHCLHSFDPGGISQVVSDLLINQNKLGHNSQLGLIIKPKENTSHNVFCNKYKMLPGWIGSLKISGLSPFSFYRLVSFLSQFDIVHLHGFHPLLYYAAVKSNAKVVHTLHGPKGSLEGSSIRRIIKRKLFHLMIKKIDLITAVSEFVLNKTAIKYNIPHKNIRVVYNNITPIIATEAKNSIRNKYNIEEDALVVGGIGQLVDWKRWDLLINLINLVNMKGNNVIGLLVGAGPEEKKLRKLAKKLNLTNKIIFTGFSSNVANEITAMDIVFHTAIGEGYGLVILEAMSCGVPVMVMDDGGGAIEIISRHNKSPLIANSVEDAAQIISLLSFEKLHELSINARKQSALSGDTLSMARNYINLYQSVMIK